MPSPLVSLPPPSSAASFDAGLRDARALAAAQPRAAWRRLTRILDDGEKKRPSRSAAEELRAKLEQDARVAPELRACRRLAGWLDERAEKIASDTATRRDAQRRIDQFCEKHPEPYAADLARDRRLQPGP